MTELERPRSYKDERDEMIDRDTNGAALDAIITGAEVLALLFFALAGKFWPMGEAYEERAYRKASLAFGGLGAVLLMACGRAMKRKMKT